MSVNQKFLTACRNGQTDIVVQYMNEDTVDMNKGLSGSCFFGHIDIAEMCINQGANKFNLFIERGCFKGNTELAKWAVEHNNHPDSKINLQTGFICRNGCCVVGRE